MSEEEIFKMLLVESIDKYPLLNELFAIRDSRGKRNDYTIFVNGYISLDVINKAIEKVNLLNNLKEIEKSHKEENEKLRVELEQYKLLEANIDKANKIIAENKFDEGLYGLLMQEKEKNKELEAKRIWNKGRIEGLKKELVQEKEKSKELNEALERSSGRVTELTVENSDLKYKLYHKQQMIDELTQSEEKLKIELGKEKEKNKELENQINFNKKIVEIAQTQILEYSQGYKDGLNKETTATAIVARELELNFIRQEIKHRYISKEKIRKKLEHQNMLWNTPNRQKEYNQEFAEFLEELLLEEK